MENYENLGIIGEGSYGTVFKARNKLTGQVVAIKKFKESDDIENVRKTSLREIRVLKTLRHENIVNLLEVFRKKNKVYLVFEYVERSILTDLESNPEGLDPEDVRKYMYQLFCALSCCHAHQIIHRDIKPENMLISSNGVVKLCDFGFARNIQRAGGKYTDYVATRWYRCPELLVGDTDYGKYVDIWAAGCMFAELLCGQPLFPGESDIDTLHLIIKMFGKLPEYFSEILAKNPLYSGLSLPDTHEIHQSIEKRLYFIDKLALEVIKKCLSYNPEDRGDCLDILKMPYFNSSHAARLDHDIKLALEKDQILLENELYDVPYAKNNYNQASSPAMSRSVSPTPEATTAKVNVSPTNNPANSKLLPPIPIGGSFSLPPTHVITYSSSLSNPLVNNNKEFSKAKIKKEKLKSTDTKLSSVFTDLLSLDMVGTAINKEQFNGESPIDSNYKELAKESNTDADCGTLPAISNHIQSFSPRHASTNKTAFYRMSFDFDAEKVLKSQDKNITQVPIKYTDWSGAVNFRADDINKKKSLMSLDPASSISGFKFKSQPKANVKSSNIANPSYFLEPIVSSTSAAAIANAVFQKKFSQKQIIK